MRDERTEVLVVGAGPVGLWTALELKQAGIGVTIVDQEDRTAARSYACALHPRVLQLLDQFGLATELIQEGRKITRIGFYEGAERRAGIDMAGLPGPFPFLLIVPQNVLEDALEQRLRKAGVAVKWNFRFDSFTSEAELLLVQLEKLAGTSTGYIVPHWETVVQSRQTLRTQFLVAADGHKSRVRQEMQLPHKRTSPPIFFAAYEFESEKPIDPEVQIVFHENTTNVLWPLAGNRCRWSFQIFPSELPPFPDKERRAVRLARKSVDDRLRSYVEKIAKIRAPWFSAGVKEITWCTEVAFEPGYVPQCIQGRCLLAGDAAHQTGPAGVQSMNAGFLEGASLAAGLKRVLQDGGGLEILANQHAPQQERWKMLLGLTGGLVSSAGTDAWVRDHAAQILPCLPGLDEDLVALAKQLGLELKS